MAAELNDHVWTLQEVLLCRVPPGPQPQELSGGCKLLVRMILVGRSGLGVPADRQRGF